MHDGVTHYVETSLTTGSFTLRAGHPLWSSSSSARIPCEALRGIDSLASRPGVLSILS